jgi:hypothetical protein
VPVASDQRRVERICSRLIASCSYFRALTDSFARSSSLLSNSAEFLASFAR